MYAIADGVQQSTIDHLRDCFEQRTPVFESVHNTMMKFLQLHCSRKNYKKHSSLNKILSVPEWKFNSAYVFCKRNIESCEGISYIPLYMMMFYRPDEIQQDMKYEIDLSGL